MPDAPPLGLGDAPGQSHRHGHGPSTGNIAPVPDVRRTSSSSSAHTFSGSSMGTVTPTGAKLPIPRNRPGAPSRHHRRVPRACASCHMRKTKCSGESPICRQCHELDMKCVYPPPIREKMKIQQEELAKKLQECQSLLGEVEPLVSGRTAKRVLHDGLELVSSSSVGSLEAQDHVDVDVNRSEKTRATGHLGKSSEIKWMQRLQETAEQRRKDNASGTNTGPDGTPSELPQDLNYHLDDFDIQVSEPVQKYWMPPRPLADLLFDTYLAVAHPYFPIINRPLFRDQYKSFFDETVLPGDKWIAILNTIFAVATSYAHLAELDWRADAEDHLVYLARARMLSLEGDDIFRHPDIQQVQLEGLITFYLLTIDQIHRAWRISALAVRSAISLGLNLQNKSSAVPGISKEMRNRVWWSLFSLENKLGMMTGRPTCVSVNMCSSPFPLPWEESELAAPDASSLLTNPVLRDGQINATMASYYTPGTPMGQSGGIGDIRAARHWLRDQPVNSGLCFLYSCDLTMITQEILDRVYAVRSAKRDWSYIQVILSELAGKIDIWFSTLPKTLDFLVSDNSDAYYNHKMQLALQYHGSKILLGRPCLCQHKSTSKTDRQEVNEFNKMMSLSALESAAQITHLIPDSQLLSSTHRHGPWWSLLHSVMQAVAIMILEISFGYVHMPEGENMLVPLTKKCIRWLHRTSESSVASRRAWQLCDNTLRQLAGSMQFKVSDMPPPPHWHRKSSAGTSSGGPSASTGQEGLTRSAMERHNTAIRISDVISKDTDDSPQSLGDFSQHVPIPSSSAYKVSTASTKTAAAYGVLDQEFIQTFFPELCSDVSSD
ncbi:Fungal Zn(2)-Cys(6) binuclear cluster domain-containing protein [Penicillium ucsense]|uniref:Fungal Zn(2)-Cys(6) binuclear cluster domain-containing protein n=1 Tax=Penicillium ucsense TaxID=2839758 RepID=A0A8J8WHJ7_9EURO|nr:Fungal Zn(2)-Cys(6) binuclear cluster domain-containing protein [Penicillium ucsense]KAF7734170.1 Fungal Zn(2)-Cys(6) binuclear cluster domain-containing protein [Penicillium ucsense]